LSLLDALDEVALVDRELLADGASPSMASSACSPAAAAR
jgi:hypothetical protein